MPNVTASCTLRGQELTGLPVINPGAWFGRAWLLEIGESFTPLFLVVEADNLSDAIDELSDSKWGHEIHVSEPDLADYPEEDRHYDGSGRVIDLGHVMGYGPWEGGDRASACLYHVEGYPVPVSPETYSDHDFDEEVE